MDPIETAWQRVEAALAGEPADPVPVSLWHHFPERDQTAAGLAEATYAFWSRYAFDFIKFMPPGDYGTIDWGARSAYQGSTAGTRQTVHFPVARAEDWERLRPADARQGMHGELNRALGALQERLRGRVPVLQTIFSPLTTAQKLSDGLAVRHAASHPAALHGALAAIAETTRAMASEALAAGADGIFFATQCATADVMDEAAYREFGVPYDLAVLEAAAGRSRFTLVHLHGERIHFALLSSYPAHALNWHDRRTAPALAEGRDRSGKCAIGGIHERGDVVSGTPDDVRGEVREALAATGGRKVMIGPGCVVPIDTPEENIAAAVAEVRSEKREVGT